MKIQLWIVGCFLCSKIDSFPGGGFGKTTTNKSSLLPKLNNKAKQLLRKHTNNVDAASNEYYASLQSKSFEENMAATWDTVAAFLPMDYERNKGRLDETLRRRLGVLGRLCVGNTLDVGCGDGVIVPFLSTDKYRGIDMSSEMISLARAQHPQHFFEVSRFPVDCDESYDSVIFNGSLQFFPKAMETIQTACGMLKPGGRVIISHVQGANFVKQECRSNPNIAVSRLPEWPPLLALPNVRVMLTEQAVQELLNESVHPNDADTGTFYLVVLEKL